MEKQSPAYHRHQDHPYRPSLDYKNDMYLETTVGQLNFFKWIVEHNIINYIKNNYEEIENDMQESIKLDNAKNKRRELSKCATKTININETKTILNFE